MDESGAILDSEGNPLKSKAKNIFSMGKIYRWKFFFDLVKKLGFECKKGLGRYIAPSYSPSHKGRHKNNGDGKGTSFIQADYLRYLI